MKKTPLLILLGLLAVCVPTAAYLLLNTPKRFTPQNELVGKKLIAGLTSTAVAEVRIADAEGEAVLVKKDGKWVIPSRGDFPIDNEKEIERLVASLSALQVGLEIPAEPRHFAEMTLLSPDQKEEIEKWKEEEKKKGEENPADPTGLLVTLKDATGAVLADLVIGEDFGGDPDQPIRGLVLRSLSGTEGIWKVVGNLNRRTGELGGTDVRRGLLSATKSWLEYDFIEVEQIKSISLSAPNDKEFTPWIVTRESDDGDFTLADLSADQEMNTGTTGALKTLFSKLRFEDVLDPAKAAGKKDPAGARLAVITTFEGFTYTFDLAPLKPEQKDGEDDDSSLTTPQNYVGTVKVEGAFKETRDKVEGETEERAAAEAQAHAVRLENLKDKLAREKAYESRIYEFANFSVSSLLKSRADLVQDKTPDPPPSPPATPGAATSPLTIPGGAPSPNRPRTAVSPPVAVPRAVTPPVAVPKPTPAPETPAPKPEPAPAPATETPAPATETPAPAPNPAPQPAPDGQAPKPDPAPETPAPDPVPGETPPLQPAPTPAPAPE